MGNKWHLLLSVLYIVTFLHHSNGQCQISGGLMLGPVPNHEFIQDVYRGIIRSEATTNIDRIADINYGGALVGSEPYLDINLENSQLVIQTSNAFALYEENETALSISVTIQFSCTGGTTTPLILVINIEDTNNNYPEFIPTNEFSFVLAPPLPPGFLITGCLNEITVKDIDLTTSSIIFEVEDNPYVEIEYDPVASTAAGPKYFKALLKTSTFIRTLREPITLRITATDVDATNDPPLSTNGIIRISADTEFEFPEEPVFSQTYYFATYTDEHQLIQHDTISLQQGFDEYVNFALDGDGEYSSYFSLNADGNQVSLVVNTLLPIDVLVQKQIYLIVRASREFTSGDSATIVIHLPEETPLLFENALYQGSIVDNALQLPPLVLSQGYERSVTARIVGEYSSSFTAAVQGNLVTIAMVSLTDSIIENNYFLSLPVQASTDRSEATTIVSLDIIKDDTVTPLFDEPMYKGSYDPVNGLTLGQITFVQGFDETILVELNGVHKELFQLNQEGPTIRLTSSVILPELFEEQQIILTIEATKPRTVGANAAIIITLPAPTELSFEEASYRGTIKDNELVHQTILLSEGFDQNVRFTYGGDYADYFDVTNIQNQVTITLSDPLPESVINQNTVIMLTLTASGLNTISATTSVLFDIIKDDSFTPVLSKKIYYGTYRGPTDFEIENIYLTQGFADDVLFKLDDSAHAQYFEISNTGNSATIRLRSAIPEDVIFNEKALLFNVIADKALTVGSNAAVLIRFPAELTESTVMRFSENYYVGDFEQNEIVFSKTITLEIGYEIGTEFKINGDYADHFELSSVNNVIQISSNIENSLPLDVIENNEFIVLTVEARRERAIPVETTVIIDIVKEPVEIPVFNQAFYRGLYTTNNELQFQEDVNLSEGYDDTVNFELDGEQATWFSIIKEGNSATLVLNSPIPKAVLDDNNQLLFTILALKPNEVSGRAVVSIDLPNEIISFSEDFYKGYIEDGIPVLEVLSIPDFIIPSDVEPSLSGDHSEYFQFRNQEGNLLMELRTPIPEHILEENDFLIFTLEIQVENRNIKTVIVLEIIRTENTVLMFEKLYYVGLYDESTGLEFDDDIRINEVSFDTISFDLQGDDAQWFDLVREENSVKLVLSEPIPSTVLSTNQQLIFEVVAVGIGGSAGRAAIIISLPAQHIETSVLLFDQVNYLGTIENNEATIALITLSEGYVPGVQFTLQGELRDYFELSAQGAAVTVTLSSPIPEQSIPSSRIVVLEIHASAPQTVSAYATLVLDCIVEDDNTPVVELVFGQTYYTGTYTEADGLTFTTPISLSDGYDEDVQFSLEEDNSEWFTLIGTGNSRILELSSPIPAAVLANNQQLIFIVEAQRPGSTTTRAAIVISLTAEFTEGLVLGFDKVTYRGSIENNEATIEPITLSEGYVPGVQFSLQGELRDYFELSAQGAAVIVTLSSPIPEQSIPSNRIVVLEIHASAPQTVSAYATLVLDCVVEDDNTPVVELVFAQTYYTGTYTEADGLTFTTPISLSNGYDEDVQFSLEEDNSEWFTLVGTGNSRILELSSPIPAAVLANNQQLIFIVEAQRPSSTTTRAAIVISLTADSQGSDVSFAKVIFEGVVENGAVLHETITITGFSGTSSIKLDGVYSSLFEADFVNDEVTVRASGPLTLPAALTHLTLELQAETARAVLVLAVSQSDEPTVPVVRFSSNSYAVSVEITETGLVGQVQASADNGEAVLYSIQTNNVHLQERLSVNDDGELYLSAPVSSGLYTFQVIATTIFTQQTAAATVHLSAEAITVCGDEIVMPPLIVLDRDEEEPHYNLINTYEGCQFHLTNRWPLDQTWVYVDETGLHTRSIDREHESIAFMTLSQVQVEITLHCDTDETRVRRSPTYDSPDPYDYGDNKWVLADTILYNSRRSLVNLIVNDINDNAPVFVGKENEPIVVGYPVAELEQTVLPRSLAELQATDADIGENAALIYWSSEPELAVAPTNGFVHIRDGAKLENDARLTVHATDQNRQGLTGSIDLVVRLLDESNILVVTVRDAFLNNEKTVLAQISESVGYEIKVLRSIVISENENNEEVTRKTRDVTSATGTLLQLYVYGLIDREPVSVERLMTDINTAEVAQVNIASSVSLEDHLAGQEICAVPGRDTGLLVATIVLSVLLFIVIVLIAVWFFLRWRRNQNYDQFSDNNSIASGSEPIDHGLKPVDVVSKPRLNIEELRKSEKRLQEMLDAPMPEVTVEPTPSTSNDAVLDMPDTNSLIVIQSKLKDANAANDELSDDEYGERKTPKRKSVVTFNENVEKIIHVEEGDDAEDRTTAGYEIYKL